MKRIAIFFLLILTIALVMTGCGKDDEFDPPKDMQLVDGGESTGYYLYAPKTWSVSNFNGISCAYVSALDTSSVSMTEIDIPDSYLTTNPDNFEDYFLDSLKNDFYVAFDDIKFQMYEKDGVSSYGEKCILGAPKYSADKAFKFVYSYTYDGVTFHVMQIIAREGDRYYLFTYQSTAEIKDKENETTAFLYHMEDVKSIMESLKFVAKKDAPQNTPVDDDGDGYFLASDKKMAGFELYLPMDKGYTVEFSEGMVSIKTPNGGNINMVKSSGTGVSVEQYYENRRAEIEKIVGAEGFEEIRRNVIDGVTLGNAKNKALYEYRYTYKGTVYRVYQIFGVTSFEGYAFTYTAEDSAFDECMEDVLDILERIKF